MRLNTLIFLYFGKLVDGREIEKVYIVSLSKQKKSKQIPSNRCFFVFRSLFFVLHWRLFGVFKDSVMAHRPVVPVPAPFGWDNNLFYIIACVWFFGLIVRTSSVPKISIHCTECFCCSYTVLSYASTTCWTRQSNLDIPQHQIACVLNQNYEFANKFCSFTTFVRETSQKFKWNF